VRRTAYYSQHHQALAHTGTRVLLATLDLRPRQALRASAAFRAEASAERSALEQELAFLRIDAALGGCGVSPRPARYEQTRTTLFFSTIWASIALPCALLATELPLGVQ
jgi:hypothetical protein